MDDLIEALQIFRKYGNPEWPTHCAHDELIVNIDPSDVIESDLKRLDQLSFIPIKDDRCFKSFRFGSCQKEINMLLDYDKNIKNKSTAFKIYSRNEIQKVYKQHAMYCGTVLYSEDGGYVWHSVPIDSGKWQHDWVFACIGIHTWI